MTTISPLPWQGQSLQLRTHVDMLWAVGGRAGGKSTCSRFHLLSHCNTLGPHAAPVVVREAFAPLHEYLGSFYEMAYAAYGSKTSYSKGDSVVTLPTGGTVYGASLHDGEASYIRFQGRNLTGIFGEEVGNFSAVQFSLLRKLESNIRPPKPFKAERFFTANPGGVGSSIIFRNWLSKVPPWRIARDHTGLTFVWMPSIYTDNTHIDHIAYRQSLLAAVGSDEALLEAWLAGKWGSVGGLMFRIEPDIHIIDPLPDWMVRRFGKPIASVDWGTHAPATCSLGIQLREAITWHGMRLPYGSIIIVDETDTAIDENDLTRGSGLDVRAFADQCHELLQKYGATRAPIVVDDAKGLQGDTVIDYFRAAGLNASKPDKRSRVEGWDLIRTHMADAERQEGRPGLYFTTRCPHLVTTLGEAPRGSLNPRDLDPKWAADHWVDNLGYLMKEVSSAHRTPQSIVIGAW